MTAEASAAPAAAVEHSVDVPAQPEVSGSSAAGPTGRTRSALIWSYALTLGRFGTTSVVLVFMARYLDAVDYGVMALAMVWVSFAQALAMHGPAQAVIQRRGADRNHFDAAFWWTLALSAVLAAIFAGAAQIWAEANGSPVLGRVCWALAPAILLNALVVVPDAILRRELRFRTLSLRVLLASLLSGAAGIAAATHGWGVWALVIQQLVQTVFSAVAVWAAVKWRPALHLRLKEMKEMWSYSVHSWSGFFAGFVATRSDAIMLGMFFGPVAIGYYRFSMRFIETITDVTTGGLSQISLPHLAQFSDDRAAFAERLGRFVHIGSLLSIPAFGVFFPVAGPFVALVGPQWGVTGTTIEILCVAGAVGCLGPLTGAALQAVGRPGLIAAIGWAQAAVTVACLAAAGVVLGHSAATTQLLIIAGIFGILQMVTFWVAMVVLVRHVLAASLLTAIRPAGPSVVATCLAAAVGWAVKHVFGLSGGTLPNVIILTLTAAAVVGLVLLVADPLIGNYRRRGAAMMWARLHRA
jgi:teichuronic acid exporter